MVRARLRLRLRLRLGVRLRLRLRLGVRWVSSPGLLHCVLVTLPLTLPCGEQAVLVLLPASATQLQV